VWRSGFGRFGSRFWFLSSLRFVALALCWLWRCFVRALRFRCPLSALGLGPSGPGPFFCQHALHTKQSFFLGLGFACALLSTFSPSSRFFLHFRFACASLRFAVAFPLSKKKINPLFFSFFPGFPNIQ
jgi:hypothetical protein